MAAPQRLQKGYAMSERTVLLVWANLIIVSISLLLNAVMDSERNEKISALELKVAALEKGAQ